jgi:hypothetical protein
MTLPLISFIISGLSIIISLISLALGSAIRRRNAEINRALDRLNEDEP